jgi:hypothetical protein
MCPTKEPHYFNSDHRRAIDTLADYEALFAEAAERHVVVAEASTWYLYSEAAVANILAYAPDARFIVMVRNPVEMAPALHEQLVFGGREDEPDFARAWQLQDERRAGKRIPRLAWEPRQYNYVDICRLGAQVRRAQQQIPPDRLLVIVLDDIRANARREYVRVLQFLGLDDDGRNDLPALNRAKTRRWPALTSIGAAALEVKDRLGIRSGLGLWRHIDAANRIERARPSLSIEMREQLKEHFAEDVKLLGDLLGRDLQHWLQR